MSRYRGPSNPVFPVGLQTANLASTTQISNSGTLACRALYMGKAPRRQNTTGVRVIHRVTTAITGTTWAELAIARGTLVLGGPSTLTLVGFIDTSAVWNTTGVKTTTVPVNIAQRLDGNDDVWLVWAKVSTGSPAFRAASLGDDLQTGVQLFATANPRPSLNLGTPLSFAVEATADTPILCGLQYTINP